MRIPPPMRCFSSPSRFTDPLGWGSFQRVPQSSCMLPAHADLRSIGFVALILYGLLRSRPKRLFVRILRQIARASNHLFTVYNANQPLGLASVPGNFHLIRTHSHLPLRVLCASPYTASLFRKRLPAHFLLGCLAIRALVWQAFCFEQVKPWSEAYPLSRCKSGNGPAMAVFGLPPGMSSRASDSQWVGISVFPQPPGGKV